MGAPVGAVDPKAHGQAGPWKVSFREPQLGAVGRFVAAAEEQGGWVAGAIGPRTASEGLGSRGNGHKSQVARCSGGDS